MPVTLSAAHPCVFAAVARCTSSAWWTGPLLEKLGLDVALLDSGCCGMAGSFGFEKEKFRVSMRCAERVLLPAVRAATADTLIVADGYSCREQIVQATGRRPLHLAQLLRLAIDCHLKEKS